MSAPPEDNALPPGTTGVVAVDLDRLAANWRALSNLVGPADCAAVVKADAYGLGADRCIPALARAGCRSFFVATTAEAMEARRLAPDAAIYVLDGLLPGSAPALAAIGAVPVLSSLLEIRACAEFARTTKAKPAVALHVCSGLNRLGLSAGDVEVLSLAPEQLSGLDVSLVMSHLASADAVDDPMNAAQLKAFERLRSLLPAARASLAASDGMMLGPAYHYDLARPGYALYGGQPSRTLRAPVEPVVSVYARILQIRDVPTGASVGYSGIWRAERPSRIATIAAGYADGVPRIATGGPVRVDGVNYPVVGRIAMDQMVIDLGPLNVSAGGRSVLGAEAVLFGNGDDGGPTAEDWARAAGTNNYEIVARISPRVPRRYINEELPRDESRP